MDGAEGSRGDKMETTVLEQQLIQKVYNENSHSQSLCLSINISSVELIRILSSYPCSILNSTTELNLNKKFYTHTHTHTKLSLNHVNLQ